jgi:hypothetical protein
MNLFATVLLAQLAAPARQITPVLSFPQLGLDDSASYQGYQTRFYRDAAGNTVQLYLDGRSGRVVHLLANSENESIGFTARDTDGRPAILNWDGSDASVSGSAAARMLEYRLTADVPRINIGWFLLGSMRVERDLQYSGRHREPFDAAPFALPEINRLLAALGRLDPAERQRHLALIGARDTRALRSRLQPRITTRQDDLGWVARVVQPSLDGRDSLTLELRTDPRRVVAVRLGDSISLRARSGNHVPFTVRIASSADPLTPLARQEIFNSAFLAFLASADTATNRGRWLERQVRGVELLSSREKLMAGLPAYATYFGRDMLVSALMMRPIWRDEMSEFVVASMLRKLSPVGQVSHEEALGGQAVREAASEYAALVNSYFVAARAGNRTAADGLLARARAVLRDHRRVRENYHMIDDEFQLPVLAARWLADPAVLAARKRAFLLDSSDGGGPRLERLLRELALVARMTSAYAANQVATNLVSFPRRDSVRWSSASWRDSGAGYGGGRYAMDVNAIWAPHALESIARVFAALRAIGISVDSLSKVVPELRADTPLGAYARDSLRLRAATDAWWGASRHFLVRLSASQVQSHVTERLAAMPDHERNYWAGVVAASKADQDSLVFLALALDGEGTPIGIANSDPSTRLFLANELGENSRDMSAEAVLRDVGLFVRPYPVGLFIERVGPVVANDADAPPAVWHEFERDLYHGPRVVWGREVNLFLLGVAGQIAATSDSAYARTLRAAMSRVQRAVEGSGFRSELWSYEIAGGKLTPIRYGSGSDVQLWSTTDLAVQFSLSRINRTRQD